MSLSPDAEFEAGDAALPAGVTIRPANAADAAAVHALLQPYVAQRLLLARTEAELAELTRHGFVAVGERGVIGFSAVEVYSPKLAELQCLAVDHDYRKSGIGRTLVSRCVRRAHELGVMEVMAISSSESFLRGCGFDYSLPDQKRALFFQLRPRPSE